MKWFFLFGSVLLLFILSCQQSGGPGIVNYEFKKGIAEIDMELLEGAPPEEVYENGRFPVAVRLINNGAYDAQSVAVQLVGLNEKYLRVDRERADRSAFYGRSFDHPTGQSDVLLFNAVTGQLPTGSSGELQRYRVITTYDYQTELVTDLCLNPHLYEVYDSGCKMVPISTRGQGSPLAITDIQIPIYQQPFIELRMKLVNQGKGTVKEARLNTAQLGQRPLQCEFRGGGEQTQTFDFEQKKVQEVDLLCRREIDPTKSFITPLTVLIDFTYERELPQQILIRE